MNTQTLKSKFFDFLKDEEGLTTVEYAIAGGLVGAAVIAGFTSLGTEVGSIITGMCQQLNGGVVCP